MKKAISRKLDIAELNLLQISVSMVFVIVLFVFSNWVLVLIGAQIPAFILMFY
ncbi:hypothetical protein Q4548_13300 [Wenyingzhuangia sp. 2_MG-2023]|nr:hypothetical protein [Wenyingzhuangia sp. 2_MG-2023]